MPTPENDPALRRRMFDALNALERTEGRHVTLKELGARIGRAMGRPDRPYDPGVVRRWLKGRAPDSRDLWIALAHVLACEPGWLAFGSPEAQDAAGKDLVKAAHHHPRPATDADLPRHRRPPKPPPDDPDEDAARPKRPRRRRA